MHNFTITYKLVYTPHFIHPTIQCIIVPVLQIAVLERQCSEQNAADWREWYWLCQSVESLHHHHNYNIRFSIPLWYKYIFSIFSRGNRNLSTLFSLGIIRTKSFQILLMLNHIWWYWRSSGSWAWQKLGEACWSKI